MSKVIWKQRLWPRAGHFDDYMLPSDAEIIAMQRQGAFPTLWFLHDRSVTEQKRRTFGVLATGQSFDIVGAEVRHVGTYQENDGALVWHVMELVHPDAH